MEVIRDSSGAQLPRSLALLSLYFSIYSLRVFVDLQFEPLSNNTSYSTNLPNMDPQAAKPPPMKDLNIDNITENTIIINSQGGDPRLKYVMERLVTHLHDFARETRLSTQEWMAALNFLVRVGQISSDVRHVRKSRDASKLELLTDIYTGVHTSL